MWCSSPAHGHLHSRVSQQYPVGGCFQNDPKRVVPVKLLPLRKHGLTDIDKDWWGFATHFQSRVPRRLVRLLLDTHKRSADAVLYTVNLLNSVAIRLATVAQTASNVVESLAALLLQPLSGGLRVSGAD